MQPINQAERRKAFVNFLVFFLFTVLLILATGFYSVQVPFKDNARLRELNRLSENEKVFGDQFQGKLSEALSILEVVNDEKYAEQAAVNDSKLQEVITEMGNMIGKENIPNKNFYRSVLSSLTAAKIAKKELRDIKGKSADATEWKEKYDRLEKDFTDYQNEMLRRSQQGAQ